MPARTDDAAASEPENHTPETKAPAPTVETTADDAPAPEAEGTDDAPAPEAEGTDDAPAPDAEATDDAPAPDAEATDDAPAPDAEGTDDAPAPDAEAPADAPAPEAQPAPATPANQMPEYKGEPLDAERGPGLGCFWIQIALLTFFLVFTPLTVTWGWDPLISGALLIITLILLLFSGQTIIFLLRLVAADRRTRRAPLNPSAKPTVGQMEDAGTTAEPAEAERPAADQDEPSASGGRQSKGDDR